MNKLTSSHFVRKTLYTNDIAKKLYGLVKNQSNRRYYNLNHLAFFDQKRVTGTMLKDEALFLFSLLKMTRPKVIVEFGFCRGQSSLNFLQAMDKDAELYSFDISESAKKIATFVFKKYKNFIYRHKSQLDFLPGDVNNKKIDLVYFDAICDRDLNISTFEKLRPSLNDDAILIIHDTDTWKKRFMDDSHLKIANSKPKDWLNEKEFQQQKGQREFHNEFLTKNTDYSAVNFHSPSILRCGLTLIQKKKLLKTERELVN